MDPLTPTIDSLLATLAEHYPDADLEPVRRGYALVEQRVSPAAGAPAGSAPADESNAATPVAFSEPAALSTVVLDALRTAAVLATMRLDPPAVSAALIAPLQLSPEQMTEGFGAEVASLVDGVHRLADIRWDQLEQEAAETLRKMFMAMAADIRVVLIALANRVQRMRALHDHGAKVPEEEGRRIAQETLDVFAPLANRLGIWQLKWELEDMALRQLDPAVYDELTRLLADKREQRAAFIDQAVATLKAKLAEQGIEAQVYGRPKHVYSIYKKMQRKQVSFDQIYDVSAVRIITRKVADCYAALGLIHSLWPPLPGEFDDYIARPKDNLYQSLHTAVVSPEGKPIEAQVRTEQMHHFAEYGVAAHWAYKEQLKGSRGVDQKFMVLRQLMDWEREVADPHQFVESLKTDIFEDQVYVFTPAGDIVDLPLGSTPLDFAYRIHTQVGHRFRGARVNEQIQPLDYQLKTGDRVQILTHKKPSPSRDWMNPSFGYLRSSNARTKVRQWFRSQGRDTAIAQGRELVEREMARLALVHATVEEVAEQLKYPSTDDMFAAVGFGDRSSQSVASTATAIERDKAPPEEPPVPPSVPSKQFKRSATGLSIDGVDDILGKRARCCNPVPGDRVVGFVSRGRGILIHRRDCSHVTDHPEPERLLDISWGPTASERHPVDVEIRSHDRPGLLRDISDLVSRYGVNVTAARAQANRSDGTAWLKLSLEFQSAEQMVQVLARIDQMPDVLEVRRVGR